MGQGWSPDPLHEAWREWHPAHVSDHLSQAKVQAGEVRAAGSIVEHGHSVVLREAFLLFSMLYSRKKALYYAIYHAI